MVARGHLIFEGWAASDTSILVAARPTEAVHDSDMESFALWDPDADRPLAEFGRVRGLGRVGTDVLTGYSPERDRIEFYTSDGSPIDGVDVPIFDHLWPSADGVRAYAGFPTGEVWTIDAATQQRVEPTFQVAGFPLEVSATEGGARVVISSWTGTGARTQVFDGATGSLLAEAPLGATTTAVSLTGTLVGAASGRITRYDLDTLRPLAGFPAARGGINSLQFSADGHLLLATASDQSVSLYDVATGTRLGDPIPSAAPFIIPGFLRPDGQALAVTVTDGVAIWDLDPDRLVAAACRLAGRDLTDVEWATYLANLGPYRSTCAVATEP